MSDDQNLHRKIRRLFFFLSIAENIEKKEDAKAHEKYKTKATSVEAKKKKMDVFRITKKKSETQKIDDQNYLNVLA